MDGKGLCWCLLCNNVMLGSKRKLRIICKKCEGVIQEMEYFEAEDEYIEQRQFPFKIKKRPCLFLDFCEYVCRYCRKKFRNNIVEDICKFCYEVFYNVFECEFQTLEDSD